MAVALASCSCCTSVMAGSGDHRVDRLLELCGVFHDEGRGEIADVVVEAEGAIERHHVCGSELVMEPTCERDVRPRQAVDRLPVVADTEQGGIGPTPEERSEQIGTSDGDVLELVDQDAPEG